MYRELMTLIALLFLMAETAAADEIVFADSAGQMVEQMLGGENYGLTRGFVIEKTRSISVRAKNRDGKEETLVVQVPLNRLEKAVRLKVEFDVDSAALRPSAYTLLAELGRALGDERVAERMVCIKGHTDSDGDSGYNLQLSFNRAQSVQNYLQGAFGLSPLKLQIFGYGESMPLQADDDAAAKQKNRRVEVSLDCAELHAAY